MGGSAKRKMDGAFLPHCLLVFVSRKSSPDEEECVADRDEGVVIAMALQKRNTRVRQCDRRFKEASMRMMMIHRHGFAVRNHSGCRGSSQMREEPKSKFSPKCEVWYLGITVSIVCTHKKRDETRAYVVVFTGNIPALGYRIIYLLSEIASQPTSVTLSLSTVLSAHKRSS